MQPRGALFSEGKWTRLPVSEAKGFPSRRGPEGCALVSAVPLARMVHEMAAAPVVGAAELSA